MLPDLLAMLFARPAIDARRDPTQPAFPQGGIGGSPGLAAAIFGSIGLLFGLLLALIALSEGGVSAARFIAVAIIAAAGAACACVGVHFGRHAARVTDRHPGMAKYGGSASVLAMILVAVSLVICAARTFL